MKHKPLLPVEVLHECFEYKDGYLFWKQRPLSHFNSERGQKISNTRHIAGGYAHSVMQNGYFAVQFAYKGKAYQFLLHRVIWTMFNGEIPEDTEIDHEDTNYQNCKIGNLRLASHEQNMMNSNMPYTNTSGIKGVCKSPTEGKWMAYVNSKNKQIPLGTYSSKEDAQKVVTCARIKLRNEFANNSN